MAQVIQKINIGDAKALAKHAAALAKARARRNAAAAQLIRSLPRELYGLRSKMKTLAEAGAAEEFLETFLHRERILSQWREEAQPILAELSEAMSEYFKHAEAVADLASRPSIQTILNSAEVEE